MAEETWFVLVSDDSGHRYIIPEAMRKEWDKFLDTLEESYEDVPEWATYVEHFRFQQWEK